MKTVSVYLVSILCSLPLGLLAQYAPQAGVAGSDAIPAGSPLFVGWATQCTVSRGWMDIADHSLGPVFSGDSSLALGAQDNFVVSLGDSGTATLSFAAPIVNGPGPDFAVFENGFIDPSDPEQAFLELAFVEVSSDGINFTRFTAVSLTQSDTQIAGAGVYMNARKLNNFAGKYASGFGVPFDLQELEGSPGLDVNHITQVRIVDAVGSVQETYAMYDASGHKINDPYPTPFPTGGFDLDAVGVIHQGTASLNGLQALGRVRVYPNPVVDVLQVEAEEDLTVRISELSGRTVRRASSLHHHISMSDLVPGIYLLQLTNKEGHTCSVRILKR